jgi:hypothetical protein
MVLTGLEVRGWWNRRLVRAKFFSRGSRTRYGTVEVEFIDMVAASLWDVI